VSYSAPAERDFLTYIKFLGGVDIMDILRNLRKRMRRFRTSTEYNYVYANKPDYELEDLAVDIAMKIDEMIKRIEREYIDFCDATVDSIEIEVKVEYLIREKAYFIDIDFPDLIPYDEAIGFAKKMAGFINKEYSRIHGYKKGEYWTFSGDTRSGGMRPIVEGEHVVP